MKKEPKLPQDRLVTVVQAGGKRDVSAVHNTAVLHRLFQPSGHSRM